MQEKEGRLPEGCPRVGEVFSDEQKSPSFRQKHILFKREWRLQRLCKNVVVQIDYRVPGIRDKRELNFAGKVVGCC